MEASPRLWQKNLNRSARVSLIPRYRGRHWCTSLHGARRGPPCLKSNTNKQQSLAILPSSGIFGQHERCTGNRNVALTNFAFAIGTPKRQPNVIIPGGGHVLPLLWAVSGLAGRRGAVSCCADDPLDIASNPSTSDQSSSSCRRNVAEFVPQLAN
jgi:hypothetical protein